MSITRTLFQLARLSADARAIRRSIQIGSPAPVARRARNKVAGRLIGRAGGWSRLWGAGL